MFFEFLSILAIEEASHHIISSPSLLAAFGRGSEDVFQSDKEHCLAHEALKDCGMVYGVSGDSCNGDGCGHVKVAGTCVCLPKVCVRVLLIEFKLVKTGN